MAQPGRSILSHLGILVGLSLWTLGPYGGCSCSNPMGASSPGATNQIYGGAEAGEAGPNLVDDFNDGASSNSPTGHWQNVFVGGLLKQVWYNGNDPSYRINFWGGGTYTQADSFGSVYFSKLGVGAGDPLFLNTPNAGLQFGCPTCGYGRTVPPIVCGPTNDCGAEYPFVQHGMYLSPQGAAGDAGVEFNLVGGAEVPTSGLSTASLSGSHGLQLDVYAVTNALQVKLKLLYLVNYTNSVPCTYTDTYQFHEITVALPNPNGWNIGYRIPFGSFKLPVSNGKTASIGGTPIPSTEGVARVYGTGTGAGTLANAAAWVDGNGNPTGTLRISAIEFDPAAAGGTGSCSTTNNIFETSLPYDFLIDNVEFY